MTAALYQRLVEHYQPQYGRRWLSIQCPACGHEAEKSQRAATSMSETGWKCQVCGEGGTLTDLAKRTGLSGMPLEGYRKPVERRNEQKRLPAQWTRNPAAYLDTFLEHPRRLEAWQSYKRLTLESIARYRLGYGVLPASKCQHPRLIVPLFHQKQIVGFRGRATACQCTKWLSSGGSQNICVGLGAIKPGDRVALIENEIDRILCQEHDPSVKMLALPFGVASWQQEWTEELVRRKPAHVLIILDNDLAGNPNREAYQHGIELWNAKMDAMIAAGKIKTKPDRPPVPHGYKYLRLFRADGLNADRYIWPNGTPYKYDIGEMFKTDA
jgi:ribosomal protein S27E